MNRRNMRAQAAFSLVEIMVVVVIIGLLAAVVGGGIMSYLEDARIAKSKTEIKTMGDALNFYKMDKGSYPSSNEGLKVLTQNRKNRSEPYLNAVPVDGWGNAYEYKNNSGKVEIISGGSDGRVGTEDDLKLSALNENK